MYHRIVNGLAPAYLNVELPLLVSSQNPYHRRRALQRQTPECDTELYKQSFFPSTTYLWNNLPEDILRNNSIAQVKNHSKKNDVAVPLCFYHGNRTSQINHCRLRNKISNLNQDLVLRHLSQHGSCSCGAVRQRKQRNILCCSVHTSLLLEMKLFINYHNTLM